MNTKTKGAIFLLLVIAFVFNNGFAFELGVGTHFGQGRGDPASTFEWMKSAEMRSFRDEIYWDSVEHQTGVFEPNENARKSLQAYSDAKSAGINPVLILSYGNQLYDGGSQPYTAEGRAAFAAYAGWLVTQLKGKVVNFEIWNEWNSGFGTNPKVSFGNPVNYVKLARTSYNAIKSANPAAKVIVGALADDLNGWPWLTAAIKAGLLESADGVSVHLYNHSMPPSQAGASEVVNRLRTLQTLLRASNGGKPVPIYVTETGWPTHVGSGGVSEKVAAEQDARLLLEAQTVEDLAGIWWYDFADDGNKPYDREHRFSNITVTGRFGSVKAFDQVCGDRVIDGFKDASANAIQIRAGTYPTLVWMEGDVKLAGMELNR